MYKTDFFLLIFLIFIFIPFQKMLIHLIYSLTILCGVYGLKSTDFCLMNERTCVKTNVSFVSKSSCQGSPYRYACGDQYCATSKPSCNDFRDTSILMRSFKLSTQMKKTQSFIRLKQTIKNCPNKCEYKWEPEHQCKKPVKCYLKLSFVATKKSNAQMIKKWKCPCTKTHPVECGNEYCAVHRLACHPTSSLLSIQNCTRNSLFSQAVQLGRFIL